MVHTHLKKKGIKKMKICFSVRLLPTETNTNSYSSLEICPFLNYHQTSIYNFANTRVCVCVCVSEKERERE